MADHPVTVRLATDEDAPAIGKLFAEAEYPDFGVDWTAAKVRGWWLVAEADGRLVGAVMLSPAQPIGFIGRLIVHPEYRARGAEGEGQLTGRLGAVARQLLLTAFVVLRNAGVQMVTGLVGTGDGVKALQDIYVRHGAQRLGTFELMGRRLS